MRNVLIALLVTASVASAGSWIESDIADSICVTNAVATNNLIYAVGDGFVRFDGLERERHDTTTEYITGFDTALVIKRIVCDTTLKHIDTDSLGRPEFSIKRECDTVYTRKIDTVWADKLTVRLTPDQMKKLMRLID